MNDYIVVRNTTAIETDVYYTQSAEEAIMLAWRLNNEENNVAEWFPAMRMRNYLKEIDYGSEEDGDQEGYTKEEF